MTPVIGIGSLYPLGGSVSRLRPAAGSDDDDLLLPAARRRTLIVFLALTVSLLIVLPALFLSIDWPGW